MGKRTRIHLLISIGILFTYQFLAAGQMKYSREDYINTFADLAMREMRRVGVPASITLAQGCLESNNGNSRLAVRANNHFGIKCHDWDGRRIYHDDDERKECFRSYSSAYESFQDHSEFLTTKNRYAFLFELSPHDYRGWAKGLKKAGYATAHNYANLLIRIIEENELYRFDLMVLEGSLAEVEPGPPADPGWAAAQDADADLQHGSGRKILVNNNIEYVLSEAGDTPESLRAELRLYKNEIYRYNNLYKGAKLDPGTRIYLQPKRRKAARGHSYHQVKEGETMYDISQEYGVKLKHLYRMNRMEEGEQPDEGAQIYLRRKKPLSEKVPEPSPAAREKYEDEEMQFRFEH